MENPVLVEVTRGGLVESGHRGAYVVTDADGAVVTSVGDIERATFPRSAVKAIQALPFVESGAADALGFGRKELSFACASHSGEPGHVEMAKSMLARAGLDETAYECGTHWPMEQPVALELAATGAKPGPAHNNCSGKHAGFLCTCRHMGLDFKGYVKREHEYQRIIADAMTAVTGAPHGADNAGIDGCSIPTYAVPLKSLAAGFARMATGQGLEPQRARAAKRLLDACMAEPWYMAGTGRACTRIMEAGKGRVFAKVGAEGVYCAAIPELGLGIALKCDDGAARAAEAAVCTLLAKQLKADDPLRQTLSDMATVTMKNWNGIEVGTVRPAGAIS